MTHQNFSQSKCHNGPKKLPCESKFIRYTQKFLESLSRCLSSNNHLSLVVRPWLQCLLFPIFGAVRHCQGGELGDPREGGDDIPGLTRRCTVLVYLKIGYPNYPIPLVDDDFPKMGIGVGYISYFETHSYSSKMGFVENVWDIQPQIATKR